MNRVAARPITVAYQGGPGANGERAIAAHWKGAATPVSMRSFDALITTVADGIADYGVVPVWNSTIGEVRDATEALVRAGERIHQVTELLLPVGHALIGLPGARIEELRAVGSHHAALDQCRNFLRRHPHLYPVAAWDTAGAARQLAELAAGSGADQWVTPWHSGLADGRADALAVIANRDVAAPLGLAILADEIQDQADNRTRFVVIQSRRASWRW